MERSKAGPEKGRLVIISGPSGVGKNTVVRALSPLHNFHFAVSATTRNRRPDETHGVEYFFVDDQAFSRLIEEGKLLEWAEFAGHRYGTLQDEVFLHLDQGQDVLLDVELNGAYQVMEAYPDAISIFLMPPDLDVLESRMRGRRGMTEAEIATRLKLAESQIADGWHRFGHVVVNSDLDAAVSAIAGILRAGSPE
ncbi:MAG: guanylate kinase [Acidimicrobiia bacterium]|nr:guanylate kinase [Acidimicrobiia bacterium]MXZ07325.1 guanylate kinase [Acidimicrobiia bacterium]